MLGHKRSGLRPQRALVRCDGQVAVVPEHARQHALDVAVEDRRTLAETEHCDRRRRRSADAG